MKHDILIADDDEQLCDVLNLMFGREFNITTVNTGTAVLDAIRTKTFHFIILDIHLPEKSGIDICHQVSKLGLVNVSQIVILSADTNNKLVREAYELGVGDYICKPFNVTTFKERMLRFSQDIKKIRELESKDNDIKGMAETAMMQAASYGSGLELIARLNLCTTPEALGKELMKHMLNQGFHTAVQLRAWGEVYSYDVDVSECSDIELQIFDLLKSHGRIYHFGKRTIFNDEHISILVKNMPMSGTRSYDAILDLVAKLVPALNKRFVSLMEHKALLDVKTSLSEAMDIIEENVSTMDKDRREMMEAIENKVSLGFHQLHLDEEQERYFMEIIDQEIRHRDKNESIERIQGVIKDCMLALQAIDQAKQIGGDYSLPDEDNPDIELF